MEQFSLSIFRFLAAYDIMVYGENSFLFFPFLLRSAFRCGNWVMISSIVKLYGIFRIFGVYILCVVYQIYITAQYTIHTVLFSNFLSVFKIGSMIRFGLVRFGLVFSLWSVCASFVCSFSAFVWNIPISRWRCVFGWFLSYTYQSVVVLLLLRHVIRSVVLLFFFYMPLLVFFQLNRLPFDSQKKSKTETKRPKKFWMHFSSFDCIRLKTQEFIY